MIHSADVKSRLEQMLEAARTANEIAVFASVNGHAQAVVVTAQGKPAKPRKA